MEHIMETLFENANYKFTLNKIKCSVEIDSSLSAVERNKIKSPLDPKTMHYHPMHELFFVFDDPIEITGPEETLVFSNCVVCVPPLVKHYSVRVSDYRILFSFNGQDNDNSGFTEFFGSCFSEQKIFSITEIRPRIRQYLEELSYLFYNRSDELKEELSIAVLKLLLSHLYMDSKPQISTNNAVSESYCLIIGKLISESTLLTNNVTLSAVAEKLCLSEKQTSRIIRKYFNKSLSQLVTEAKLDYSVYLLNTTLLPISQVAYMSNFYSENYFYAQFKKHFGCTPLQYRKNHRGIG